MLILLPEKFDHRCNLQNSLFIVHLNIFFLQKHFDSLHETPRLLPELPHIIGIFETRIKDVPLENISFPNHEFIYANLSTPADGVGLYISNCITFDVRRKNELLNIGCEDLWISITLPDFNRKIILVLIYRHPSSDASLFVEVLNKKMSEINLKTHDLFIMGDINLNLISAKRSPVATDYLFMLVNNGLFYIELQKILQL